jgi:hypothetical protein
MINRLNLLITAIALLSCGDGHNTPDVPVRSESDPDFRSADDCHNEIQIWLDGGRQFRAEIKADIPLFEGVEFAGYYLRGDNFLMLVGIAQEKIVLIENAGVYWREGVTAAESINQGWKLNELISSK